MEEQVITITGGKVFAVVCFFTIAILFFRWMYYKINKIEPEDVVKTVEVEEESYLGENLLRGFVFVIYMIAMLISQEKQHSQILTISAFALSGLISWVYHNRRKIDREERLREERWNQGIYEEEVEEEPKKSFFHRL